MPRRPIAKPFHGATASLVPRTFEELCAAYQSRAAPGQCFTHGTAARLLRLPVPPRIERETVLHVGASRPNRAPRVRGVVGHELDPMPRVAAVGGLRVAHPVDTWAQLSTTLTKPELVVLGDCLVRKKRPFATLTDLEHVVAAHAGRRGARVIREALGLVRPLTASPPETELRLLIITAGLPEPLVGYEVHDNGYFVGTPDLAYPEQKVAIEYEGEVHRVDLKTFRDDIERRERFEDAGWRVIRVTADHLLRPNALIDRIHYALGTRAR